MRKGTKKPPNGLEQGKKFDEETRMEILKGIGMFWPRRKITDHIRDRFGKVVSNELIAYYEKSDTLIPIIEKFRDQYIQTLSSVPLFHKKKRLEELQEMYETFKGEGKLVKALMVLRDFREECEAKRADLYLTSVNNYTYNEYKNMTNEELDSEYLRLLEQKKRLQITDTRGD